MARKLPSYRETVQLPVGYEDPISGELFKEAEVRPVTGGDELYILEPDEGARPGLRVT